MRKIAVAFAAIAIALVVAQPAFADSPSLEAASPGTPLATQAVKWRTISTPEQLRVISLKSEGFGPGYYKIGNDFSLSTDTTDYTEMTCGLINGTYVIDFNGHTVQSQCDRFGTFRIANANVTFLDSKASSTKPSVNALGVGCIEVLDGGTATILNGNYTAANSYSGGSAVFVGNGKCTINGGTFSGSQNAICNNGGTLRINNGQFQGGYPYALLHLAGTTKIVRGSFYGRSTVQGYPFAIGVWALDSSGNPTSVNMNALLASGSSWGSSFGTVYYNGQSNVSAQPSIMTSTAASYAQTVTVTGKVGALKSKAVTAPKITSLTAGQKKVSAKWNKVSGATKYQLHYSKNKNMKGAKTVNVAKSKTSRALAGLASGKRYYVQVRAFRSIGGHTYYSAWSGKKSAVVK